MSKIIITDFGPVNIEYYRMCHQSINKTGSGVRLDHIRTGLHVLSEAYFDRHKNKARAMSTLRGRVEQFDERKAE